VIPRANQASAVTLPSSKKEFAQSYNDVLTIVPFGMRSTARTASPLRFTPCKGQPSVRETHFHRSGTVHINPIVATQQINYPKSSTF
jgi:hypothetical protein